MWARGRARGLYGQELRSRLAVGRALEVNRLKKGLCWRSVGSRDFGLLRRATCIAVATFKKECA